jgi:hypothetical protein
VSQKDASQLVPQSKQKRVTGGAFEGHDLDVSAASDFYEIPAMPMPPAMKRTESFRVQDAQDFYAAGTSHELPRKQKSR